MRSRAGFASQEVGRGGARWAAPPAVLLALWLASPVAVSQTTDGYVEVNATRWEQTQGAVGEPVVRTNARFLVGRLNFTYTQPLWPHLSLLTGGFFERSDSSSLLPELTLDNDLTRLRPFATLRLTTPLFRAEVGVDRNETRNDSGAFERRVIRDRNTATLGWYPTSQDFVQALFYRTDDHDGDRSSLDRQQETASVTSRYVPVKQVSLHYEGFFDRMDDRANLSAQDSDIHTARVHYADAFWDRRLVLASDYRWTRSSISTRTTSDEEANVRVFPDAALSAIDDTPERDRLPENPLLIDRDLASAAGVNLGLPPPDGDAGRRNLGVEFKVATEARRFRVWVDRELPPQIAAYFTWEIWTSDDGEQWTFRQSIGDAPFDPLENRFQLSFGAIVAHYFKVVVRPLVPTVAQASEYPVIEVAELEAFAPAKEAETRSTAEQLNLNARLRLLSKPAVFYDLNYLVNTVSGAGSRTFVVNGVSLTESLSPVWSVAARIADERSDEPSRRRVADTVAASLTAVPLPALRSSVLVGGRREEVNGKRIDSATTLLSASATIYRGVDVNASMGTSKQSESGGRLTSTRLANISAEVRPHRVFALYAAYDDSSREISGGGQPTLKDPNAALEVGANVNPIPTLYIFGSRRYENRSATGRRTLHNLSLSWSPFPRGTLRFSFYYNEFYESDLDSRTRSGGPSVRWNVNRRTYLNLGYEQTRNDSSQQYLDRSVVYGTLRVGF